MSRLEDALRNALRREDPPPGFAERVMNRVAEAGTETARGRWSNWFRLPALRLAAACVLCALLATGLVHRYQRRAEARREAAHREFILAMRITSNKLEFVRGCLRGAAARDNISIPLAEGLLTLSKERK